jgi:hypothetical protein
MGLRFAGMVICAGTLLGSVLLGGCSGDEPADATYFAGLDPAVVTEVLQNPAVQERIQGDSREDREMRLQGSVINFVVCRDLLRVYRTWVTTGAAPEPAPLPAPEDPRADWRTEFSHVLRAAGSGDPDQLRQALTGEGTCGSWIPATPGQPAGPTIEDAIRALS